MTIPAHHPRTLHLLPYWYNNSYAGLLYGRLKGYKYADQDMQCDAEGQFWGCHWALPKQDGYIWLWTGKKIGKQEERVKDPYPDKPISKRTTGEVARLRRYYKGNGKGWRYTLAWKHAIRCQRTGMIMCGEAKGGSGFEKVVNWQRFSNQLKGAKVRPFYVMTLQDIGDWHARLEAAQKAGFETALLPRGKHKPTQEQLKVADAVWGHW